MFIALLAAVLLDAQAAGTTVAPAASAVSAPSAKPASADDDKVVCKNEQVTGTRFSTRTCHTKHDWAQIEQDSRDELMNQQSQSFRNPSNGH